MPGTHLNDTERDLMKWWNNEKGPTYPSLRKLSIEGNPGIRGIKKLNVDFKYPLTVICGRNGSGKSTILALAALGFHSPKGHFPLNATHHPKGNRDLTWYTFSDFFFKGPEDPDITGIKITWEYNGADRLPIEKKSDKWMHYDRRPRRPVNYLGAIRSIPAIELPVLRSHFGGKKKIESTEPLNESYCRRFSDIMRRTYDSVAVLRSSAYSIRKCRSGGNSSSSFNMGSGEDILIDILHLFQESKNNSLIIIEEIEIGLHPEALIRLAKHLQEIILEKKLQVIISTHSNYFIDNVPRLSRILIQREGDEREVRYEPTTRFAMGIMSGRADPELNVYCEDNVAAVLIEQALPGSLLKRTNIIPVGSDSQLVSQATFHLKAKLGRHILIIWDGEVSKEATEQWIKDAKKNTPEIYSMKWERLNWTYIPGGIPPDKWIIKELKCEKGYQLLSDELRISPQEAEDEIERLCGLDEHHSIGFELKQSMNITSEEPIKILARCLRKLDHNPLEPIRIAVQSVLNGQKEPTERSFLGA